MNELRRCWWCGIEAEVDSALPVSGGLIQDNATMDGRESWICQDNDACNARGFRSAPHCLAAHGPAYPGGHEHTCNRSPHHMDTEHFCRSCTTFWTVSITIGNPGEQ